MLKQKIVENYFDAKLYTNQEIIKSIEKTKKEYAKKIINVNIKLNEFGVFVVTYYFKVSENIFQKIFIKIKQRRKDKKIRLLQEKNGNLEERKKDKIEKRFEKYSGNKYGEYKSSGIYKPY